MLSEHDAYVIKQVVNQLPEVISRIDSLYTTIDELLKEDGDLSDEVRAALSVLKMHLHTYSDNLEMRKAELEKMLSEGGESEVEQGAGQGGQEGESGETDQG